MSQVAAWKGFIFNDILKRKELRREQNILKLKVSSLKHPKFGRLSKGTKIHAWSKKRLEHLFYQHPQDMVLFIYYFQSQLFMSFFCSINFKLFSLTEASRISKQFSRSLNPKNLFYTIILIFNNEQNKKDRSFNFLFAKFRYMKNCHSIEKKN